MSIIGALSEGLAGEALVGAWALRRLFRQYRAVISARSRTGAVDVLHWTRHGDEWHLTGQISPPDTVGR